MRLVIFFIRVALFIASTALIPTVLMSLLQTSFHLVSGRPFFLLPALSVISTLSTHTRTYHFNRFSVTFLEACVTLAVSQLYSFLILSLFLLHTSISTSSSHSPLSFLSCRSFCVQHCWSNYCFIDLPFQIH